MIKKLESKSDKLKKERRLQFILAGILIFVMLGSVFGIVADSFGKSSSNEGVSFNGQNFITENGYYTLTLGNSKFYFSFDPNIVESLIKQVNLSRKISSYAGQEVYILSNNYPSYSEIVQNLGQFTLRIQGACKEGEECLDKTLPIKTCNDNLIVIKELTENKIYETGNCVYIEGKDEDLLKLTDEFLLREIGIK